MYSSHVVPNQIRKKAIKKVVGWKKILGTLSFLICFTSLLMCLLSFTDKFLILSEYRYALFSLVFVAAIVWWMTKGKVVNDLDNEIDDDVIFIIRNDKDEKQKRIDS